MTELLPNPRSDLSHADSLGFHTASGNDKCSNHFSVLFVWETHNRHFRDFVVGKEAIFHLKWMDVLAASNDEVFDSPGNGNVSFFVHGCFVTGLCFRQVSTSS